MTVNKKSGSVTQLRTAAEIAPPYALPPRAAAIFSALAAHLSSRSAIDHGDLWQLADLASARARLESLQTMLEAASGDAEQYLKLGNAIDKAGTTVRALSRELALSPTARAALAATARTAGGSHAIGGNIDAHEADNWSELLNG